MAVPVAIYSLCEYLLIICDQVFIKIHRSRQAVIAKGLVCAVDALLLLRSVYDWCESDAIAADGIVKSGIRRGSEDVGTCAHAGKSLHDSLFHIAEGSAAYIGQPVCST